MWNSCKEGREKQYDRNSIMLKYFAFAHVEDIQCVLKLLNNGKWKERVRESKRGH
jgi:hypothetical protein